MVDFTCELAFPASLMERRMTNLLVVVAAGDRSVRKARNILMERLTNAPFSCGVGAEQDRVVTDGGSGGHDGSGGTRRE